MSARRRFALVAILAAAAASSGCVICDSILKDPTLGPTLAPLRQTSDDTRAKASNVTTASTKAIEGISPQDERAVGQASSLIVIAPFSLFDSSGNPSLQAHQAVQQS